MAGGTVRLKDGGAILRSGRAGEGKQQPKDTWEDDQSSHSDQTSLENERSLVDPPVSAITDSGYCRTTEMWQ